MQTCVQNRKTSRLRWPGADSVDVVDGGSLLLSPRWARPTRGEWNPTACERTADQKPGQVEPLTNLPEKVNTASRQNQGFLQTTFPQAGTRRSWFNWESLRREWRDDRFNQTRRPETADIGHLQPVEMEADLSGNYVALAKFINALKRDDMFFIINSVELGGEQNGPIKLQMKLETYFEGGKPSETGNRKSQEHDFWPECWDFVALLAVRLPVHSVVVHHRILPQPAGEQWPRRRVRLRGRPHIVARGLERARKSARHRASIPTLHLQQLAATETGQV